MFQAAINALAEIENKTGRAVSEITKEAAQPDQSGGVPSLA
jgi:hypothetical protein